MKFTADTTKSISRSHFNLFCDIVGGWCSEIPFGIWKRDYPFLAKFFPSSWFLVFCHDSSPVRCYLSDFCPGPLKFRHGFTRSKINLFLLYRAQIYYSVCYKCFVKNFQSVKFYICFFSYLF